MGFFDKLTDYVNTKGKDLEKNIKTFTATTKLQSTITEKEDQIAETLKTIGQMYYATHVNDPDAEYAEQVNIIAEAQKEIEKIKKELEVLKGLQTCPACGESVSINASFCPKCGNKMPKHTPVPELEPQPSTTQPQAGDDPVEELVNTVTQDLQTALVEAAKEENEETPVQ